MKWDVPTPKQASANVQVSEKEGARAPYEETKNQDEAFNTPPFAGTPAVITFDAATTINLGNFQSAKVGVGLHYPCDPRKLDEGFEFVQKWVTTRMEQEVAGIRASKVRGRGDD